MYLYMYYLFWVFLSIFCWYSKPKLLIYTYCDNETASNRPGSFAKELSWCYLHHYKLSSCIVMLWHLLYQATFLSYFDFFLHTLILLVQILFLFYGKFNFLYFLSFLYGVNITTEHFSYGISFLLSTIFQIYLQNQNGCPVVRWGIEIYRANKQPLLAN